MVVLGLLRSTRQNKMAFIIAVREIHLEKLPSIMTPFSPSHPTVSTYIHVVEKSDFYIHVHVYFSMQIATMVIKEI